MRGFFHGVGYAIWIAKEIFVAGFDAVAKAFNPATKFDPIVIYYPLRINTDWDVFWFSTSITATPGTLSMGLRHPVTDNGPLTLLVQAAFGSDPEEVIAGLVDMEEHLRPSLSKSHVDHGSDHHGDHVPPAERMV